MGNEKSKTKYSNNPREEHKARLQNNQSLQSHQTGPLRTSFADAWEPHQRNRSFDGIPSNSNKENGLRSNGGRQSSTLASRRGDSFLVEYLMSTLIYEEDMETMTAKYILEHLQERKGRHLLNVQQIELKLSQYEVMLYDAATKERQDVLLLERMEACHHITGSKIFNSLLLLIMIVPSNSRQRLIYMFQCSTVPADIIAEKLNVAKAKIPIRYSQESDKSFESRRVTAAQPINNGKGSYPSQVGIAASQSISPISNYYTLHSNTTSPAESFANRLPVSTSTSSVETIPVQHFQPQQQPPIAQNPSPPIVQNPSPPIVQNPSPPIVQNPSPPMVQNSSLSMIQNSQLNQNKNEEDTPSLLKGLIEVFKEIKASTDEFKQFKAQKTNKDTDKVVNKASKRSESNYELQGTASGDDKDQNSSSNKNESEDEKEGTSPEPQIAKVKSERSLTPKSTPKNSKRSKKRYPLKGRHLEDDDRYSITSEESNRFSASRYESDQFRQKLSPSSSPSVADTLSSRMQEQSINDYTNNLLAAQQQTDIYDAQLQLWHHSLLQRQQDQSDYQAQLQEAAVSHQQQIAQVALQQATIIQQLRDQVLLQQDTIVQHQQQEEFALKLAAALEQQQELNLLLDQQREEYKNQLHQVLAAEQLKQQQTAILQTVLQQQQYLHDLKNIVETQSQSHAYDLGNVIFTRNAQPTPNPHVEMQSQGSSYQQGNQLFTSNANATPNPQVETQSQGSNYQQGNLLFTSNANAIPNPQVETQSQASSYQQGNLLFTSNANATPNPQVYGQNSLGNLFTNPSAAGQDQALSLLLQQQALNQNAQNQANQLYNNDLQQNLLLLQRLQLNGQQQF